ncbi:MAG: twitching motility protein PilT [Ignavibacteria bacterium RBG_16_35_7]|nr:MAG: twitching motility protein PilT [Ignavibacteria bacterium RBG_16_35_7]
MLKKVTLRFYEELNDFLPSNKRKRRFEHNFIDRTSVKDLIESLGIPHTEIDLILVNGNSVDFSYLVNDGDDISGYPMFESLDITNLQHLRAKPLRKPKFILDVHLGTLAKYMRMLGFDTLYKNDYIDEEIVKISLKEKRAILTKDRGILKRSEVTHGYWIRSTKTDTQIIEVIKRFDLKEQIKELSRCLLCNSLLKKISKEKIIDRLPRKVKEFQNEFYCCKHCDKIFWKGSHYAKMLAVIERFR